jgi:hypothetical protein
LETFRKELPFRPVIEFLRDHDFGASFKASFHGPLDDFCLKWTDAAHEFLDKRLERTKEELVRVGREFTVLVGQLTWRFGADGQSVKGDPNEDPSIWEDRGERLNQASVKVVEAHQALEREGVRWAARRPVGEAVAVFFAAVVVALPAGSFALYQRRELNAVKGDLTTTQVERDTLRARLGQIETRLAQLPPATPRKSFRAVRERLGAFVHECDSLVDAPHVGVGVPPEQSKAWRERVRAYLRNCGLDSSFEAEFMAAASEQDEGSYSSEMPEAMWKRRKVLLQFIDKLRSPEDL